MPTETTQFIQWWRDNSLDSNISLPGNLIKTQYASSHCCNRSPIGFSAYIITDTNRNSVCTHDNKNYQITTHYAIRNYYIKDTKNIVGLNLPRSRMVVSSYTFV